MGEQTAAEQVNALVERLTAQQRRQWNEQSEHTGTVVIGRFGNLVDAVVSVEQRVALYTSVRLTAVATCSGFGCVEPAHEFKTRGLIFGCDHGALTEEERLEARKWAQAHAETCRAMPKPGGEVR
ncbi:hypothetical protein ACWGCW_00820 [Streptomyces sp. NPDC054933]